MSVLNLVPKKWDSQLPELRYTTQHTNLLLTVFFQRRVLNPHPEPTKTSQQNNDKNNNKKSGNIPLHKRWLDTQRLNLTFSVLLWVFPASLQPTTLPIGENKQQRVRGNTFIGEKKEKVRAISKVWGSEFHQIIFNNSCSKTIYSPKITKCHPGQPFKSTHTQQPT